jgi:hypothetical protein
MVVWRLGAILTVGALLIPAAAADPVSDVNAAYASFSGTGELNGAAALFWALGRPLNEAVTSQPSLTVHAGYVSATHYRVEYLDSPAGRTRLSDEPTRTPYISGDVNVTLLAHQAEYVMHIFGSREANADLVTVTGEYKPMLGASLVNDGIEEGLSSGLGPAEEFDFTRAQVEGPVVYHALRGDQSSVRLEGDFTLEIMGLDIQVRGDAGTVEWTSGTRPESLQGAVPSPSYVSPPAGVNRVEFIRLNFVDATLDVSFKGGHPLVEAVLPEVTATHSSQLLLEPVQGTDVVPPIPVGKVLRVTAQESENPRLLIEEMPSEESAQPSSLASVAALVPSVMLLGLPAALAVVGLVYLLRREHHSPTLSTVEALLEKGRYRHAARVAGRILRYDPRREDALISRAVALNKGHRPARVVAELEAHLKTHKPTDGVLHYVLGLSYLDLGRKAEGEECLHEAVRRTPSLRPEVTARLGGPPPVHHAAPTAHAVPVEAHGYA